MDQSVPLLKTPLHDLHRRLGARMTAFAGYELPLHYERGLVAEHLFTREKAGLFDVSHMGQMILSGAGAARGLETLCAADLIELPAQRTRYTQFLDGSGGILDDLMATRLPGREEAFFLVVNAATKGQDFALLSQKFPQLRLLMQEHRALLALQGPLAARALAPLLPGVESLSFMDWRAFDFEGAGVYVTRSGYTGEDGFEISLPAALAEAFAERLLADPDVAPIGLGARDSLRLEAGVCLCGHDIDRSTDPVEAGLAFSIGRRRRAEGGFPGFARIAEALSQGPRRRRLGLLPQGKAPVREGAPLMTVEGAAVGRVTSGGFSPSLRMPIAMGYVASPFAAADTALVTELRGRSVELLVTKLPFVPHRYVHLKQEAA
ncbi:MAG TPA: glycine cleavage system aminomethyltransferase GcvT [Methylocystis sp.]|nr:glycine cleavage system aminomethyltransferase GcvT [Methylocystis sp.]